ncbi:hypothetical protein [Sphingomonas sanguinis]|jgi:hypothetical protein|uniref:Uncharacterized protein n=1 Tax=Sphingomonas sanguinis TaxID=33051 RepID=A0A7Y7QWS6_9SPHN|nr:hypothetical protein [Sphingomonas sanguinis]MBZ6382837.1 hypothetical protein [Sphingomonas sanguinis]NNG51580.1 hypothetical protein [Sphingomonas sanguinis]NNG52391.1 hypothetical protein [Sphingomonas sanguinis]NVP32137.1 hypothetical protein [Sphingomonas sanguinis]
MTPIELKIDRKALSDTLFSSTTLYAHDSEMRNVSVHAHRWIHHTKTGAPDMRYNPVSKIWKLDPFCKALSVARDIGHFKSWQESFTSVSTERSAAISKFAHVSGPNAIRGDFKVQGYGLYWSEWSGSPLYWSHQFEYFCDAVDCILGFRNALRPQA